MTDTAERETLTPERARFLAERKTGLGGSDAAALLGLSRYHSPYSLWVDKMGLAPEVPGNERMDWGTTLEPFLLTRARRDLDEQGIATLDFVPSPPHRRHPEFDFMVAHVDALGLDADGAEVAIIETKTAGARMHDAWAGGVPLNYICQVQHYLAVTGLSVAYVPVLIGEPAPGLISLVPPEHLVDALIAVGHDFRIYPLARDEEFIEVLIEAEENFWVNHVLTGTAPEPDGTESTKRAIEARFGRNDQATVAFNASWTDRIASYHEAKARAEAAKAQADLIANQVRDAMGDAARAEVDGHLVARRSEGHRKSLDKKALVAAHPEVTEWFASYESTSTYPIFKIFDDRDDSDDDA